MSRIGKKSLTVEKEISVSINHETVQIVGPKGTLNVKLVQGVNIEMNNNLLKVKADDQYSNLQGLYRSIIQNALIGVKEGWQKTLELVGVGFRAQTTGSELILNVGFSHPVKFIAPHGISFQCSENKIIVSGVDKYLVGELAAKIRRAKPPEPYKGKGIRYLGEIIRKKAGKAAKTVGGTTGK